jgi:hypothetical protein
MKSGLLLVGSLTLTLALSAALVSRSQKPLVQSEVTSDRDVEEYAVYSAFINQKYIQPDSTDGFSLKGEYIHGFGPDKIEEVVILPRTLPTLDYYISQTELRAMLPLVEQPAFSDYLAINDQSYPLVANFNLNVAYSFFSKQDGYAESPVVYKSNAPLDRFVVRHPNALGYLSLSRVGFTTDCSIAVVGYAQTDFDARSASQRMLGGLVSLRKQGGKWTVRDVYSNSTIKKPMTIDLAKCAPVNGNLIWGLGSANVSVKGRRGATCLIEHMSEIEQGYTESECRIPVTVGMLKIYEGHSDFYYSVNITHHCKVKAKLLERD